MTPTPDRYERLCAFLEDRPDPARDWAFLLVLCLLGFAATVGAHLLELSGWDDPRLWAAGERLMATHDAYCWLAGAKGVNGYADFGMSRLAALLSSLTGLPLWSIGFWSPPLLAGLSAVAAGLWGWRLGGKRAAIVPALTGALTPGFFFRTRLGYYDSDVFTQLMPLVIGLLLAVLIAPCCARAWRPTQAERDDPAPLSPWLPWLALAFGLVARVAHFAHDDVQPLGVGLFWLALGLVGVTGLRGRRVAALRLLLVYGLAAYGGPRHFGAEVFHLGLLDLPGLALAAALAWLLRAPAQSPLARRAAPFMEKSWPWLAALAALALTGGLLLPLGAFWAKALSYFKPVADAAAQNAPHYPGITQSIREAKNVANVSLALAGMSTSAWAGAASVLGLLALLALRPATLLLAPMMALGFASMVLGARFTMFGGPVLALGFGVGLHWAVKPVARRLGRGQGFSTLVQGLAAALSLLLVYAPVYGSSQPAAVLSPVHAEALLSCRTATPKDAEIWDWWDYGYAAQYFAERMTPSDGGKHDGRDIYATALALTTNSPRQAAQMILLSASRGNEPAKVWDKMGAQAAQAEIESLRESDLGLAPARPQYLVVGWDNVLLLYWISYYGSWDVATGHGRHASVGLLREPVNVDADNGTLVRLKSGSRLPLASAEILSDKGVEHLAMPSHPGSAHLVVNQLAGQAVLLDDEAYNSMAVQLLIGDPAKPEPARYFKLVHEGFPLVRIYEVLPGAPARPQAKAENS